MITPSSMHTDYDVIIVGGSFSGSSAGLLLKQSLPDLRVLIVERQTAFDKKYDPGKWGPSAAGTVEEGETYQSNIIKELQEEIGLETFLKANAIYKVIATNASTIASNINFTKLFHGQFHKVVTSLSIANITFDRN